MQLIRLGYILYHNTSDISTYELRFPFSALFMGPLQAYLTLDPYSSGPCFFCTVENIPSKASPPPLGQCQGPPRVSPVSSPPFIVIRCCRRSPFLGFIRTPCLQTCPRRRRGSVILFNFAKQSRQYLN